MCSTVDLCFLCLTYNKIRKSILSLGNVIEDKCRFILSEKVNIRPEVSYICLNCLKNLNFVYDFKQMCLQNINTFNSYVDTLETKQHLKVTITDLQYQKNIERICNNESVNEISPPIEVVLIKEEIDDDDNCVLQDVLEGEEVIEENDVFCTPEKPENSENINDSMQYSSSLNEESHIVENFLNKVKKETELNLIAEEIQIKDECLFEATDSDSEDESNIKLLNEETNKPDCNSTFSEGDINREKDKTVDSVNRHKCDKCHKSFSYPSALKRHSRTHTRERPSFECTTCKKTFRKVESLSIHNCTNTSEKLYECDICNKKFTTERHLIVHHRIHNNVGPFKCSVCHKAFSFSARLTEHMRIHTGEKPYQCQICQHKFSLVHCLKRHMQKHTGEKPIQCQVCQYRCAQSYDLKKHMRIHTGEKPFHCQLCEYKCSRAEYLTGHMRIHTGEKPFQCKFCQYKCALARNLQTHMRVHTKEKPYKCKHCRKAFSLNRDLKRHMQVHHTDKI